MRARLGLILPLVVLLTPLAARGGDLIIPAGTLLQCTIGEPNLSSKTADVDDPVVCHVRFGRAGLPYGTNLVGRFAEYRDPGHFVGKGWMQIDFDRMVLPGRDLPLSAKVIYVPGWPVDRKGRIHGKGHAGRDIVGWSIPLFWPVKVVTLPMRGPRPKLTNETRVTLKIMDDVVVPDRAGTPNASATSALGSGQFRPANVVALPAMPDNRFANSRAAFEIPAVRTVQATAVSPAEQVSKAKELTLLMMKDGKGHAATDYWFEGGQRIRFTSVDGTSGVIPIENWDPAMTLEINRQRGVAFAIRSEDTTK